MPETFESSVCLAIEQFLIDHAVIFLGLALLFIIVGDLYSRYVRVNRDTDHVDLLARYNYVQLRRRYK